MLYQISVRFYYLLICLFSPFHKKAKLWLTGRKNIFERIQSVLKPNEKRIWIHAASLGEFEQGRPLIEEFKKKYPDIKIVLTFFSPSGYEIRKNYKEADYIFYLPIDTKSNAKQFINLIQPVVVFYIKYEFWFNYLNILKQKNIPVYLISAIFRKNQVFFKWYGKSYRKVLYTFTHLFVQNNLSKELLEKIGIANVTITGDTRFDRVYAIAQQTKKFPMVDSFSNNSKVFIAGSTWQPDEEIIIRYFNETHTDLKLIIAPHEIHASNIERISTSIKKNVIKYSEANETNIKEAQVLIIDNIGMLSSLYQYGQIAYIGGGFGVGIHNTLEAATFGLPIIFGPNYQKFQEAKDLIAIQAAFSISNYQEYNEKLNLLLSNQEQLKISSMNSKNFVQSNIGATHKILEHIGIEIKNKKY